MNLLKFKIQKQLYKLKAKFAGDQAAQSKITGEELREYWSNPPDDKNKPEAYKDETARSDYLVSLMDQYAKKDDKIFELGCNIGRNLNHLYINGYSNLASVEINSGALEQLRKNFPEMAANSQLHNSAAEEFMPTLEDNSFDVMYTMAVLLHIHPDSEWIFEHMVRATRKHLIIIEAEASVEYKLYARDYKTIFESLGMTEVFSEPMPVMSNYTTRVFKK